MITRLNTEEALRLLTVPDTGRIAQRCSCITDCDSRYPDKVINWSVLPNGDVVPEGNYIIQWGNPHADQKFYYFVSADELVFKESEFIKIGQRLWEHYLEDLNKVTV